MHHGTSPQPVNDESTEKKLAQATATELPSEAERDEQALARLGKKPILKVLKSSSLSSSMPLHVHGLTKSVFHAVVLLSGNVDPVSVIAVEGRRD
ncbi:MAG: hypothetical protein Q9170_002689 [Blastenia crenularia]